MRAPRILFLIAVLIVAGAIAWFWGTRRPSAVGGVVTVYYTKTDGRSEVPWTVSMRAPLPGETASEHLHNAVLYAATQALAGPPANVEAVRFPPGTHALSASVNGATAEIDLSREVTHESGDLGESGAFKSLVWTLTALPGIDAVAITIEGQRLANLPGGHLELDEPLRRSDW